MPQYDKDNTWYPVPLPYEVWDFRWTYNFASLPLETQSDIPLFFRTRFGFSDEMWLRSFFTRGLKLLLQIDTSMLFAWGFDFLLKNDTYILFRTRFLIFLKNVNLLLFRTRLKLLLKIDIFVLLRMRFQFFDDKIYLLDWAYTWMPSNWDLKILEDSGSL